MLAVAVSARASTTDREIEVTLSPGLRTSPLLVTPAGVADRWRNIGSCQKTSLANALQVEETQRIAHNREKKTSARGRVHRIIKSVRRSRDAGAGNPRV